MSYGKEVRFTSGYCDAGDPCTITKGTSVTYTNQYTISGSINFGLKKRNDSSSISLSKRDASPVQIKASFNIGASYSYSEAIGYSTSVTHGRADGDVGCGYWTFIPYIMS